MLTFFLLHFTINVILCGIYQLCCNTKTVFSLPRIFPRLSTFVLPPHWCLLVLRWNCPSQRLSVLWWRHSEHCPLPGGQNCRRELALDCQPRNSIYHILCLQPGFPPSCPSLPLKVICTILTLVAAAKYFGGDDKLTPYFREMDGKAAFAISTQPGSPPLWVLDVREHGGDPPPPRRGRLTVT